VIRESVDLRPKTLAIKSPLQAFTEVLSNDLDRPSVFGAELSSFLCFAGVVDAHVNC